MSNNKKDLIDDWEEIDKIVENLSDPNPIEHLPQKKLSNFSILGMSKVFEKQMETDVFVLPSIAISGQWTTLYGPPNSGKTLLTLWMLIHQIKKKVIKPREVFYINADDTFRGMVTKLQLAEEMNFHMLVPNQNEFTIEHALDLMFELGNFSLKTSAIIVLDTLKKFADLMDKRKAAHFGNVARSFVANGGTLIALAHTNKHRDTEGRGIYAGTSDIVDDCDCVYLIDKMSEVDNGLSKAITVEFTNKKSRGDVISRCGFSYQKIVGGNYKDILASVSLKDTNEILEEKKSQEEAIELERDQDIISGINEAIKLGIDSKTEIIKHVKTRSDASFAEIVTVLEKRAGKEYALGHRWYFETKAHNKKTYYLLYQHSKIKKL